MARSANAAADVLFEISWEVCNKVGGIYTVVQTKIPYIKERYQGYICIGPDFGQSKEFDERQPEKEWKDIFKSLENRGVKCRYGIWTVPGEPTVILVDASGLVSDRDTLKAKYWEHYGIDSLKADWMFDEPMCFSTAAGMIVEEYVKRANNKVVCQAHEWMSGFAILHLKSAGVKVGTVFTTHATMLGRTIAGNGYPLYDMLESVDPLEWAYKLNVQDKHLTEVACAKSSDAFTTVSEITGLEAEALLDRKPDVLLFNGFNLEHFPTFEDTSIKHGQSQEHLTEFITYYFFPYYQWDLDNTLVFFTSGRYEYQNKGHDVIMEALDRLNKQLKDEGSDLTVVFIFWVMDMGHGEIRRDVLENKNFYAHAKGHVEWNTKPLVRRIVLDFLAGKQPGTDEDRFTSGFLENLKEAVSPLERKGRPPISTHDLPGEDTDPLVRACYRHNLLNDENDRVKVIIYPGFLDGSDGLLNLEYYDATVGTHLGVFPSQYEPWGYTPLESAVMGVPAVTTDLAGFGRYIDSCRDGVCNGIFVVPRHDRKREDVIADLTKTFSKFVHLDRNARVHHGYRAKELSNNCGWKEFVCRYIEAHNLALSKGGK
ncbi:hypothetical protein GOV11_03790 [Candidatus Woesearchaeota archaeon]|nr:hypothetical protein [Candidatus Woesearchaeota archaeon]